MIIIEKRLDDIFKFLPKSKNLKGDEYNNHFGWGDQKELNAFLSRNESKEVYPLIWLLYPLTEKHLDKHKQVDINNLSLIISVKTNEGLLNRERFTNVFEPIIFPLYDNIKFLFKMSNIINVDGIYEVIKYPNYGELNVLRTKEQHITIDVWDAIKIKFNCSINGNCIKPIIFK